MPKLELHQSDIGIRYTYGPHLSFGVQTANPLQVIDLAIGPGDGYWFNLHLCLFNFWVSVILFPIKKYL